jgi:hypothetical protein
LPEHGLPVGEGEAGAVVGDDVGDQDEDEGDDEGCGIPEGVDAEALVVDSGLDSGRESPDEVEQGRPTRAI